MYSCLIWGLSLAVGWIMVLLWHVQGGEPLPLLNGAAYAVLGVMAVSFVSRCAPGWLPAFKRVGALLLCASLAGIDVAVSGLGGEAGQKLFFSALLGIAMVVLAARHAPRGLRRRWLAEKGDA